jgi:soluble lytic murein transglycosylase-like protein
MNDNNIEKINYLIKKNNPRINDDYSKNIARFIFKNSMKYNIDPKLFAAILMQESTYKLAAKNCKKSRCTDYGISQIHKSTVKNYNFDKHKLLNDLEYSIEAGFKVLSDFKEKYGNKEKDYWTRYNTSHMYKRKIYKKLVMRYYH